MAFEDALVDLKRVYRRGEPAVAVLVWLGRLAERSRSQALLHFLRNGLEELAGRLNGRIHSLEHNRYLLVLAAPREVVAPPLAAVFEVERGTQRDGRYWLRFCEPFSLPEDYRALRARLRNLGDAPPHAPADAQTEAIAEPRPPAQTGRRRLHGRLDAGNLAVLLDIMDGLELGPFIRRQAVYRLGRQIEVAYVELFAALDDIARVHFPDFAFDADPLLRAVVRRHLDRLLLAQLLIDRPFERQAIGINLTPQAVVTPEFGWLEERTRPEHRRRIVIELHWADVAHDVAAGEPVLERLRAAGFRLAIDRLTLRTLGLVRVATLEHDFCKVALPASELDSFTTEEIRARLGALPRDRLVLTSCDHRRALAAAQIAGVRLLQGWLVDRVMRETEGRAGTVLTAPTPQPEGA